MVAFAAAPTARRRLPETAMRRPAVTCLPPALLVLAAAWGCQAPAPMRSEAAAEAARAEAAVPPPMREPFTTYLQVLRNGERVGYAVRYDEVPDWAGEVDRSFPAGVVLFEDRSFRRIGFHVNGRLYGFDGARAVLLDEGTVEETLPALLGPGEYGLAPND